MVLWYYGIAVDVASLLIKLVKFVKFIKFVIFVTFGV